MTLLLTHPFVSRHRFCIALKFPGSLLPHASLRSLIPAPWRQLEVARSSKKTSFVLILASDPITWTFSDLGSTPSYEACTGSHSTAKGLHGRAGVGTGDCLLSAMTVGRGLSPPSLSGGLLRELRLRIAPSTLHDECSLQPPPNSLTQRIVCFFLLPTSP